MQRSLDSGNADDAGSNEKGRALPGLLKGFSIL
jgi:hypothetical protein